MNNEKKISRRSLFALATGVVASSVAMKATSAVSTSEHEQTSNLQNESKIQVKLSSNAVKRTK